MGLTTTGINKIADALLQNAYVGLGTLSGSTFTEVSGNNYERVSASAATLTNSNGVITNTHDFYFKDADDGTTPDSLTPQSTGGWGQVNALAIFNGSTGNDLRYAGSLTEAVTVYQGMRVKFAAGDIQLTIVASE